MSRTFTALIAVSLLGVAGCGEDMAEPEMQTLSLSFTGLDPLSNGYHYEGWAIIAGAAVSTGKFNVAMDGSLVTTSGSTIAGGAFDTGTDLEDATDIVITIEPNGDADAIPADTHVLAGSVSGSAATLAIDHGAALGDDFAGATGKYILATPTDGTTMDENSGIWFLSLESGGPMEGLDLPTLPAGWAYEGWVVMGGQPVTTGRFTATDMVDGSAPFSGGTAGPPFPGEDFLMNAPAGLTFPTDLAGATAVISIEPEPDDSSAPFTLKPLVGDIDPNATDHTTYTLPNNAAASSPMGSATIG